MNIEQIAKSYNPWAKGYFCDPNGLLGVREHPHSGTGLIVWLNPETYQETGSTETPEGAEFVAFH